MKKKLLPLFLLLLALAAPLWLLLRRLPAPAAKTNLLLVTLDTQRADRLGCYGDRLARTPNLDALARAGILFENAYTPVPLTLPAHCSLLSGRWPFAHGVRSNSAYALPAAEETLAEMLAARGYETGALVAAYVLKRRFGLDQGFAVYDDRLGPGERPGDSDAEIPADQVYQKFSRWLQQRGQRPFFLWVHFYDAHKPYAPPAGFAPAAGLDPYRGEVAHVDYWLGRLLADLRHAGLWDNTLAVVAGDHGEAFGEHGERGHGVFCYEESVRVPLIFAGGALRRQPARVAARARLVDVLPTLAELLGLPLPPGVQGESLVDDFSTARRSAPEPRPVYLESLYGQEMNNWAPLSGLISGRLKYISLPQAELYDLPADPGETHNLFLAKNLQARRLDNELAAMMAAPGSKDGHAGRSLSAEEKRKLAALGYVSSFAASAGSALDPKQGIVFQERFAELVAALDRGETERVEAEAQRLRRETTELRLPLGHLLLHYLYERQQRWRELEANLLDAVGEFADQPAQNAVFQGNLAEFYLARGSLDGAERIALEMLRADGRQARVLEMLGRIAEARGDLAAARQRYQEARAIEPGNLLLEKKLLLLRLQAGERSQALADAEQLLAQPQGGSDADLLFTAAMLQVEAGNPARAEELLRRAAATQPTARRFFDYALLLGRNGKQQLAIAQMERALAAQPSDLDGEQRAAAARALRAWKQPQR